MPFQLAHSASCLIIQFREQYVSVAYYLNLLNGIGDSLTHYPQIEKKIRKKYQ